MPLRLLHTFFLTSLAVLFWVGPVFANSTWAQIENEFSDIWRVRKQVLLLGQDDVGGAELDRLLDLKEKHSLTNIPEISTALLQEIKELGVESNSAIAARLDYARRFSPTLALVDLHYCGLDYSLGESLQNCARGFFQKFSETDAQMVLLSNSAVIYQKALFWLCLLFFFAVVVLHIKPTTHLWAHRFQGLYPSGAALFVLSFTLMAWILLGWLGVFLILTLIFWKYVEKKKRLILFGLFLLASALPYTFYGPAFLARHLQSVTPILINPLQGLDQNADIKSLESHLEKHPNDAEVTFTLALMEKNAGNLKRAKFWLKKTQEIRPTWGKPWNNLASIQYLERKTRSTIESLKKAIKLSPESVISRFNLGSIYLARTQLTEGRKEMNRAKEINGSLFSQLKSQSEKTKGKHSPVDEYLSQEQLLDRAWNFDSVLENHRRSLFASFMPQLSPLYFWLSLLITLGLAFTIGHLYAVRRVPKSCEKCGQPSCSICDPAVEKERLCSQCYHIFVRLEAIDPEIRSQKEREISRYRWVSETLRWSSAILPGLGGVFLGKIFNGVLLLFLTLVFFVILVDSQEVLQLTNPLNTAVSIPSMLFLVLGLLFTYFIGVWTALRQ